MKTKTTSAADVKRDILWRVYTCFIAVVVVCAFILVKAFTIQQVQGKYWRSMSDSLHEKIQEIDADRGTIYSDDGQILSTSIPQFDVYIDFNADGLIDNNGKLFNENIDSLSYNLASLFQDKSKNSYEKFLKAGYASHDRYFLLKKKVGYEEYKKMKTFPLVRLGRNKSGFIAETKSIRLNPFQMLAYRTIGLDRENSQKVGLEHSYDTTLKGTTGKRLVRFIAGGVAVPVDDSNFSIAPENGKDIVSTLDMHMQEIAENALMKMMIGNEAQHGCAIIMEVKTGKIKAMANLGKSADGSYSEDFNYALTPTEPGSTFKLVTMLSALEDHKITLNDMVDLQGGVWQINGRTVYDAEKHGLNYVTIKKAFELSSNVGLAKVAYNSFGNNPSAFLRHINALGINHVTGVDLSGERRPQINYPGTKYWSATSLPWMGFGYNIAIAPLETANLYNSIANGGKMMKPYLVDKIQQDGVVLKQFQPTVVHDSICSKSTWKQLYECLYGVCHDSLGSARKVFKNAKYNVCGKTGTALVAQGTSGYANHIYQSTLAGFFPSENPQFTIVVVIVNKPFATHFYGADVAGPVFREISDQLYSLYVQPGNPENIYASVSRNDSNFYSYTGMSNDMKRILHQLSMNYIDSSLQKNGFIKVSKENINPVVSSVQISSGKSMPQLAGLGLKDAIDVCENMGLKVNAKGVGKVAAQSIAAGQAFARGQLINIELN